MIRHAPARRRRLRDEVGLDPVDVPGFATEELWAERRRREEVRLALRVGLLRLYVTRASRRAHAAEAAVDALGSGRLARAARSRGGGGRLLAWETCRRLARAYLRLVAGEYRRADALLAGRVARW